MNITYSTNNLGLELYVLHAEINDTKFLLSYLFLENDSKCKEGIRTSIF